MFQRLAKKNRLLPTACRSLEERECRRRLVQFWRRHENNNILCTFKGVAAADRVPNSIVVSCIYWEDKQDFFITSVDCIYLLESLIAVRFTVEEKNRIRRNLEGFRPLTVSKCKAESADFFKLIMSFPNPKPRNIEKDVKVFPWRILPLALKKIIGKYTASYSSTASAGLDAFPASRASGGQPLAGVTLSAPAGGMMAFSPHAQPTGLLDGSSASASVVAAAAAARSGSTSERAGAHLFTPSPASGSSSLTSSSANLTTLLEAQAAKLDPSSAGISSAYMTPVTAGMCLGFDIGAQLPIGVDTSHAVSSALNSVMADFGQLTSPVAAHRDFGQTIAPAHLQNHSFGADNECQGSASSSTAALTSGHSTQLGLAGMVMDSSQPLLGSGLPGETTASFPGSSIFEQLAASCGFPALSYGQPISERVENNGGAKSQRVVRGASSKRPAQHAPYSVNRSERQKLCSTSSDCGAKGLARPGTPARVGTSLSSSCDRPGERGASPSIPLILEQQTTRTADTAARPPLLFDSNPAASAVEQSQSLTQLANEFTNTKAASVPFRDLLQKPAEDKLYLSCVSGGDGDRAPASDSTSASILGLEMGSDIASSDFNFLADLFRMPGASQSDCSLDSVTVGSASPTHGSAAPEMGARLAQTDSGGDPTAAAVSVVLSPSTVLAKSAPQFVPGLQPSGASPKLFGGALFGDVTILTRPSEG
ncbi:hypothetical protein LPJ70_000151 [Coemansia sp. RSA 2708]|nr:hypothetical protein LPJ70_000151 [Coemansia sp. RSA 2708]